MEFVLVLFVMCMCIFVGFGIGILQQRWVYYKKTGKHLQDLKSTRDEIDSL